AFGCVLYEMLTARQAFDGETITDMLAKIVTGQPDLSLLPAGTPPAIRLLLETTLSKNLTQRLQHIGDVRLFLDPKFFAGPTAESVVAVAPQQNLSRAKLLIAALAMLLLIALVPAVLYFRASPSADTRAMRFDLVLPGLVGGVSASPDGQR